MNVYISFIIWPTLWHNLLQCVSVILELLKDDEPDWFSNIYLNLLVDVFQELNKLNIHFQYDMVVITNNTAIINIIISTLSHHVLFDNEFIFGRTSKNLKNLWSINYKPNINFQSLHSFLGIIDLRGCNYYLLLIVFSIKIYLFMITFNYTIHSIQNLLFFELFARISCTILQLQKNQDIHSPVIEVHNLHSYGFYIKRFYVKHIPCEIKYAKINN